MSFHRIMNIKRFYSTWALLLCFCVTGSLNEKYCETRNCLRRHFLCKQLNPCIGESKKQHHGLFKGCQSSSQQRDNAVYKCVQCSTFLLGGHFKILNSSITLALLSPCGFAFCKQVNGSVKPKNTCLLCKQSNKLVQRSLYLQVHNHSKLIQEFQKVSK